MATYIDVFTGFLEGGKTTVISKLLESSLIEEVNNILLIICEEGFSEYDENLLVEKHVQTLVLENKEDLNDSLFKQIALNYNPDYIIVEFNGTWNISGILGLKLPMNYKFRNVAFVSDAVNFRNQLGNMAAVMQPHILNSDIVIFNRFENNQKEVQKKLIGDIKNINSKTAVAFFKDFESDKILKKHFTSYYNPGYVFFNFKTLIKFDIFIVLCFTLFVMFDVTNVYSKFQTIAVVFLGILMQAIPFILFGAFVSAAIQMFSPSGRIIKHFSEEKWYTFLIASVAGVFMPICDCGTVPIISGLLKKDTPLPQTITFWLSSSAVNPIVIVSMLYAFPDKPYLVFYRVAAGLIIGILAGLIIKLSGIKTENVVNKNKRYQFVGKDILELKYDGVKGKIEAVFAVAKAEFFRVSEYVIIGALISAVLQSVMPIALKNFIGNKLFIQFAVMTVAAMIMSTCSTSNAFIGRSFANSFSTIPILSFIVMGPMLDIKNMLMLSEVLKKKYLLYLGILVILEGAIVFGIMAFFL